MAVPSADGRGQVLQPVQMMQLPGQPYHFVSAQGQQSQQYLDGHLNPASMVLPPLPNNGRIESGLYSPLHGDSRSRVANYAVENHGNLLHNGIDVLGASGDLLLSGNMGGGQYPVDPAIASLYSEEQRPPLETLLGQIRRLSKDQIGCRLVQQALDDEGPTAATLILNEGLPFWGEAMVDPFGNYLFQKVLEKVTADERIMLVKSISQRLVNASLNLHGTRSVQKVVELCALDEQVRSNTAQEESAADVLTATLAPAAARLCIDSHGNHVIQRILLKLGPKHTQFVFAAVAASVGDVARHRHGCCVIQRCLDSPPSEARANLVLRIVDKSLELMQDAYGNYVVQYVLDVCSDEDVAAVCESVVGRVNVLAVQKFSSNVIEKCLERCNERVKALYLAEMSNTERIHELMLDPFGNYVVQRALSVSTHQQAVLLIESMRPHLISGQTSGIHGQRNGGIRNTAGGRRIIAKICRRFPGFTLNAMGTPEEPYISNKGAARHHQQPQQILPHHLQVPMMANYPPIGTPQSHRQQHYVHDPRLVHGLGMPIQHQQQEQQPPYYNLGGISYYEHQHYNNGGFPGM
jgi:hypothetical protein